MKPPVLAKLSVIEINIVHRSNLTRGVSVTSRPFITDIIIDDVKMPSLSSSATQDPVHTHLCFASYKKVLSQCVV